MVTLRLENFLLKLVVKEQPTSDEFRTTHGERTDAWLEDFATLRNIPLEEIRSRKPDSIFEEQCHESILAQMFTCRYVDSFLKYIVDLLFLILTQKKEMLRSSETLTWEQALQYDSVDELVQGLAEEKVYKLSYKSFADLNKYMSDRGLPLAESDTAREFAQALIEIRNLIAHNSGVVNKRFKKRLPTLNVEIGSRIGPSSTNVDTYRQLLTTMAADVDQRAIQKFGLSIL